MYDTITVRGARLQNLNNISVSIPKNKLIVLNGLSGSGKPTLGFDILHLEDTAHLLAVLQRLVNAGNTVVVVEHNLDLVQTADWVIDLGPEGGEAGGRLVAAGTPEEVAAQAGSVTGLYLTIGASIRD
jgi:excinuclease UvrABC ATPase subunit